MKTLNLDFKLLEKPSEIEDLKRGDIVPVNLCSYTDPSLSYINPALSYCGLALCLDSGKSPEIGFLEIQSRDNLTFNAHYISKKSLYIQRDCIANMPGLPGHRHYVIGMNKYIGYNEDLKLLQEALKVK